MAEPIVCLRCGGLVEEVPGSDLPLCTCEDSKEARRVACPSCGGSLRVGSRACPYCNSTLATCRCPSCTAWNLAAARYCQACGRPLEPDALGAPSTRTPPVASGPMQCPRCNARLVARCYAELDVDECDCCGGMYISCGMMDRIIASRDVPTGLRLAFPKRPYQRETSVRYLHCPVCQGIMNRNAFGRISGVIVDVCKNHGVWFDSGELGEVLAFIERGGLEEARRREIEELTEQARTAAELAASSGPAISVAPEAFDRRQGAFQAELSVSTADFVEVARDIADAFMSLWRKPR